MLWVCCLPAAFHLVVPASPSLSSLHSRFGEFTCLPAVLPPLLPADQDAAIAAPSHGDPPVTSRHFAPAQLARQRSRPWGASHAEVDSLQAAMDDFQASCCTHFV